MCPRDFSSTVLDWSIFDVLPRTEIEFSFESAILNQKIITGGSEAHSESGVGTFATKFTFDTDSIEDIVTQLYNNQVCPVYKLSLIHI